MLSFCGVAYRMGYVRKPAGREAGASPGFAMGGADITLTLDAGSRKTPSLPTVRHTAASTGTPATAPASPQPP
eukprot:5787297-Amphidinium_carterae.1